MAHRLSLVLLLASLALAGCGDDNGDTTTPTPEPPAAQPRGVELVLDRETAMPGDTLQLTVVNHTRGRLEYGLAYRLERFADGSWRWVNRDAVFAAILKVAEPGRREREEIRLPDDLSSGRYRIVKSFRAPATERTLDASVEFRVSKGV